MNRPLTRFLSQPAPSSAYWLMAANLLPIYGVIFLHWNLFQLLFLYWLESAVIGVYNIFRMMKISPRASLATVPFFILHYGLFMFVHLIFISLFAGFQSQPLINSPVSLSLALLSLFISHGISYLSHQPIIT